MFQVFQDDFVQYYIILFNEFWI